MNAPQPPRPGHQRQWLRCRKCAAISFYDFVPYSFSNPVLTMPCRHGLGERDMGADTISEADALEAIAKAEGRP